MRPVLLTPDGRTVVVDALVELTPQPDPGA